MISRGFDELLYASECVEGQTLRRFLIMLTAALLVIGAGEAAALTVFADDFSDANGTPMSGKSPDIGLGTWNVTLGAPGFTVQDGSVDTFGADRLAVGTFIDDLGAGEILELILTTVSTGGSFHSLGWAGVGLFEDGSEAFFFGDVFGDTSVWRLEEVFVQGADTTLSGDTQTVTFTYDFDTGVVALYLGAGTGGTLLASLNGQASVALDQVRFGGGTGGAMNVDSIQVSIVPEPATGLLLGLGLAFLGARRRASS
jgi:hypothetical protein